MEQYEQPGGNVRSKVPSEEYKKNYDEIFRKKETTIETTIICQKCGHNQNPDNIVCKNCGEYLGESVN